MDVLIGQLATGLSLGSILLLAALGLALTFGQMGVINMAHGEFIMAGCYTAFVVQKFIANAGVSLLVSLALGFLVGGLLGALLEVTLIRRMYHRPLDTLLVTFGVGLILQQVARDVFGAPAVNVTAPAWLSGGVEILGAVVPRTRIFILVLAIVCVTVLAAALKYSPMGRRIRAVVQNRDLAETSGISSRRTDITTFFIGSGLASPRYLRTEPGTPCDDGNTGTVNDVINADCDCEGDLTTGVSATAADGDELRIWPNPATDEVWVDIGGASAAPATVIVRDLQGRTITMLGPIAANGSGQYVVQLGAMAQGTYILDLQVGPGLEIVGIARAGELIGHDAPEAVLGDEHGAGGEAGVARLDLADAKLVEPLHDLDLVIHRIGNTLCLRAIAQRQHQPVTVVGG